MINWNYADTYEALLEKSKDIDKPILLDLHSGECSGCQNLEENIYQDPTVVNFINEKTLPLRVFTDNPDQKNTHLINNHIFIWSPTVQLIAPDGTRYHEWYGAPRQTRYSVNYTKTHHEVAGELNCKKFLAQLFIALGKAELRKNNLKSAREYFEKVNIEDSEDEIALEETKFWLEIINNNGKIITSSSNLPIMYVHNFSKSIERFINTVRELPDDILMQDWKGTAGENDWAWYTDCLREVFLQIFQKLNDFSLEVRMRRKEKNTPLTMTHEILADFHLSYREFQSALFNVKDEHLDIIPFKGERSLRENIAHCILSEWWAHGTQIRNAYQLARKGEQAALMPALKTLKEYGEPVGTYGTLNEMLNRYESLHCKLLLEFSQIKDSELNAYSKWWEPEAVTIGFRLKRLGWHLRDHKVSLERILENIGYKHTAVGKFCQLLYLGLAKAEAALIGINDEIFIKNQENLVSFIDNKALEVHKLV